MNISLSLLPLLGLFLACSFTPPPLVSQSSTALSVVFAYLDEPEEKGRATSWQWTHLHLENRAGNLILDTMVAVSTSVEQLVLPNLEADSSVVIEAYTTSSAGDTVHLPVRDTVDIVANVTTPVTLLLYPRVGSVQLQLYDLATTVDTLVFSFEADSGSFVTQKKRSSALFLSLDYVPYGATGTLSVKGYSAQKEVLLSWDTLFTFTGHQALQISFVKKGSLAPTVVLSPSLSSLISGTGANGKSLPPENDHGLMIAELCVTAGSGTTSRDFLELWNYRGDTLRFDSLTLGVGSVLYPLGAVQFLPFERRIVGSALADTVWGVDDTIALDLVSTSGQLFLFSGSKMLDYLLYYNETEAGWSKLSSSAKCSWEFVSESPSPQENNYPQMWKSATVQEALFEGSAWWGTPHQ